MKLKKNNHSSRNICAIRDGPSASATCGPTGNRSQVALKLMLY